jgi:hemerythrin-like domain-containing protein
MEIEKLVLPIGPLMIEHRLIERMITVMAGKLQRIQEQGEADPRFIETAVNFIRIYADACHHGKEEKILFRDLQKKDLKPADRQLMDELIEDHKLGRKLTGQLVEAKTRYEKGDNAAIMTIVNTIQQLVNFYPKHIEKEDKLFFKSAMEYLSKAEKDAMLKEEYEFDQRFIHVVYKDIVKQAEDAL